MWCGRMNDGEWIAAEWAIWRTVLGKLRAATAVGGSVQQTGSKAWSMLVKLRSELGGA
jgi:hypothetical protein